jgi:TrpR-related protein YerC/YecD
MPAWKTEKLRLLARAFLSLKTEDEALAFLRDVGTLEELREWANRFEVAQLLEAGKSYRDIARKTGLSTATVTRVAHWFRYGEGGYKTTILRKKHSP